jgi:hypothetical protein
MVWHRHCCRMIMDNFWQVDHRGLVQKASDTLLSQELDGLDAYWTIGGLSIPIILKVVWEMPIRIKNDHEKSIFLSKKIYIY